MEPHFNPGAYTAEAKANWSSVAEAYDRMSARLFGPLARDFEAFVGFKAGHLVLDVACGTGLFTMAAAKAVGPAGRVVGVDLSPGMLKIAMSRATTGNLEYREMDAQALDFPDETFDLVVSQLGLMLFADPRKALVEMTRVCKKGGTVACAVQGEPDRMAFTSLVNKSLFRLAPQLKQPGAPNLYAFAPSGALESALSAAGLAGALSSRVSGTLHFDSPEDYWTTITLGGGRTGSLLRSLPPQTQAAVKEEVLAQASLYAVEGRLEIPYEIVMAKAHKP